MELFNGTAYFPTHQDAEAKMTKLPPFAPSKFLSKTEIERGAGLAKVREFGRGFAIQLGDCGNYFPSTTADGETPIRFFEISEDLRAAILRDADYSSTEYPMDGVLAENEIAEMHKRVRDGLSSKTGDESECVISTRQLAILLAALSETQKLPE